MSKAQKRNTERFWQHVHTKNKELICKAPECKNKRKPQSISSYCSKHKARLRKWHTLDYFRYPAGAMRKYIQSMDSFLLYHENQKPIQEATQFMAELLTGNFSHFEKNRFDKHLTKYLAECHRGYKLGSPTDCLSRVLAIYLLTVEHPDYFPDTSEGIKPFLAAAFFKNPQYYPGTRITEPLFTKIEAFLEFLASSVNFIIKIREKNPEYLTHKIYLKPAYLNQPTIKLRSN